MKNYAAYQQSQNTTEHPRDIEYRLLGQVTAALLAAKEKTGNQVALVDAVLWNRNVWSAFRVDLLDPGNQLPKEIKAQLISISLFIERETTEVMNGTADLEALIDINKQIMDGLRPKGEAATAPQPANQPSGAARPSFDSHA
jgi:flagellar biosynthesis activator protein FlaF